MKRKARAEALSDAASKRRARVYLKNRYGSEAVGTPLTTPKPLATSIKPLPEADGIMGASSKAYEAAKSGGKHHGFLEIYEELPDHLVEKAARSLSNRAAQHRNWIASPRSKVGPDLPAEAVCHLVESRWPKEVAIFEEQIEILRSILKERRK